MKQVDRELEPEVLAAIASAMEAAREDARENSNLPAAGHVGGVAQLRARREAVRNAGRPITAIQVMALACAFGLLGACFGATSAWFQATLRSVTSYLANANRSELLSFAVSIVVQHGTLVAAMIAIVLFVPGAVYFVLVRD